MIAPPPGVGVLQFVVLASLRAAQLMKGCRPKLEGLHKPVFMALLEVSQGKVSELIVAAADPVAVAPEPEVV